MDHPARQFQHAAVAIDGALRPQVCGFERRRKRNHFEYRPRLERHRYRMVLPIRQVLAGLGRLVRVVSGIAGHGQDVAGVGVHGYQAAAYGVVCFHRRRQFPLGHELQAGVNGKSDRRPRPWFAGQLRIDPAPLHVRQHSHLPRLSAQVRFERLFDARVSPLFEIHPAQQVRRQRPVGIVPLAFALDVDPFQVEVVQPLPFLEFDFALDPQEAAVAVVRQLHFAVQLGAVQVQLRRQNLRRHFQIRNAQRINVDGFGGRAHRQHLSVAVEQRAARSRDLDRQFLPCPGHPDIFRMVQYLERDQLSENGRAPGNDDKGEPFQTTLDHKFGLRGAEAEGRGWKRPH